MTSVLTSDSGSRTERHAARTRPGGANDGRVPRPASGADPADGRSDAGSAAGRDGDDVGGGGPRGDEDAP